MTDLEYQASQLLAKVENASEAERLRLQPQIDRVVTTLAMRGQHISRKLRSINNKLRDEALDDMFDNMPV